MTFRPALWAVTAALAGAAAIAATPRITALGQQDPGISPAALAQIDSLLREKEARTPTERKIDSQLLYALRQAHGLPPAPGMTALEVVLPFADDGHIVIDVKARLTPALLAHVRALTSEMKTFAAAGSLQLHVDADQVTGLAADPDVIFIQPFSSSRRRAPAPAPAPRHPKGTSRTAPRCSAGSPGRRAPA